MFFEKSFLKRENIWIQIRYKNCTCGLMVYHCLDQRIISIEISVTEVNLWFSFFFFFEIDDERFLNNNAHARYSHDGRVDQAFQT